MYARGVCSAKHPLVPWTRWRSEIIDKSVDAVAHGPALPSGWRPFYGRIASPVDRQRARAIIMGQFPPCLVAVSASSLSSTPHSLSRAEIAFALLKDSTIRLAIRCVNEALPNSRSVLCAFFAWTPSHTGGRERGTRMQATRDIVQ